MAEQRGIKPPLMYLPRRKGPQIGLPDENLACGLSCSAPIAVRFHGLIPCSVVLDYTGVNDTTIYLYPEPDSAPGSCIWVNFSVVGSTVLLDVDGGILTNIGLAAFCIPGGAGRIGLGTEYTNPIPFDGFEGELPNGNNELTSSGFCGSHPFFYGIFYGGSVELL